MRILLCESSCYKPLNPYFHGALEIICLQRGYAFAFIDEAEFFPEKSRLLRILRRVRGRDLYARQSRWFNQQLCEVACQFRPQLLLVVNGKHITLESLNSLKKATGALAANYATDDPFNSQVTTEPFRTCISKYDIYATPKKALIPDLLASGCATVLSTRFAFSPAVHFPEAAKTSAERSRFDCDVVFIGSYVPERLEWLRAVIRGLPDVRLHIYGAGWSNFSALRKHVRRSVSGREFRLALSGSRIALNFIRHENRDDHSERGFQILACGGFMLSERTTEQQTLFTEDKEAAYFGSSEELVSKIQHYLLHDSARVAIARAGFARVTQGKHTYEDRLLEILSKVVEINTSFGTCYISQPK